ncbi:MAG: Calx-beta domain-containing protein, partial [Chthoniobacteraceae bacterium]
SAIAALGSEDNGTASYYSGLLDEVRISTTGRSDAWVRAGYLSTTDAFVTVGAAQTAPVITGIISNDSDPEGQQVRGATIVSGTTNGAVTLNPEGTFVYTPNLNFTGTDSFTYTVNDGFMTSNVATVTITVAPVNDPPVNSVPGAQTTNEDTPLVFSSGNGNLISISDVDAGGGIVRVTLNPTNGRVTLSTTAGLTFATGDGAVDSTMTFTGTVANINAALAGLSFSPTPNFNGAGSLQIITDDQGNTGAGGALSDTDPVNITVNAVNDPPIAVDQALVFDGVNDKVVVNPSASLTMTATMTMEAWVQRQGTPTGTQIILNKEGEYELGITAAGTIQWAFTNTTPGWNWVDTGYVLPANQWTHIAVTYNSGVVNTYVNGALVDSYNGTGPIGDTYPLLNELTIGGRQNAATQRFQGLIDEVRVWNTARSAAEISTNYDQTLTGVEAGLAGYWRFSEASGTTAFDLTANANHGTLGGGVPAEVPARQYTFTTNEDTPLAIAAAGIRVNATDAEGSPVTATLVSGPSNAASFTLNADGSFSYTPVANYSGPDSFVFRVNDGALNSRFATVALTVVPLNDAPVGTDKTVSTMQDTAYVFTVADFGFSDPNDTPANTPQAVRITTLPAAGTVTLNGTPVTAGDFITVADITGGLLRFVPGPGAFGTGYANFTFQVQDNGGVLNGGIDLDQSPNTITVNVVQLPTLNVSNATVTEGTDSFAQFTVSLSNAVLANVSFNLALANGTASGSGTDYGTSGAGNLQVFNGTTWVDAASATIVAGQTSVLVRTPLVNDALDEANETFTLTATRTAGTTSNVNATGTGTILDNDLPPDVTINDVTVNEAAGTATFTVSLSVVSGQVATVTYSSSNGTATAGADYTAVSGTLTFAAGATTQTITVPILNDAVFENSETFNINLTGSANAIILDGLGVGTIRDDGTGAGGTDNDTPTLAVSNVAVTEGTDAFAQFTVSLGNASTTPVSFNLALVNVSALGGGTDYGSAGAGNLQVFNGAIWVNATSATIAAGQTSVLVRTPVVNDTLDEASETFTLTATRTAGTTTNASATGTATIADDDPTPSLATSNVTVNEAAGTATFTVTLSAASSLPVSVNYSTSDGTATAGLDYTVSSGTLNLAPGATSQTFTVPILNDAIFEQSEFFNVTLNAPSNATVTTATVAGTITDDGTGSGGTDDDTPTLSVNNVTATEGTDTHAVFAVSLGNLSTTAVSFNLALANGTALGGGTDFGTGGAGNLQVSTDGGTTWADATGATIAAGGTSVLVRTPVVNDALNEAPETFTLTATRTAGTTTNAGATGTGTIADNDAQPVLSINNVTVNEAAGSATFIVSLSAASGQVITVGYATGDGTATAADYTAAGGTLTFAAGETSQT